MKEKISLQHDSGHSHGYEKKDINAGKTILYSLAAIAVLIFFVVILNEVFILEKEKMYYEIVLQPENPELLQLQAREDSLLNSYELIDTADGIYRIPIDSAIELTAVKADNDSNR